jgi:hypothetical protein
MVFHLALDKCKAPASPILFFPLLFILLPKYMDYIFLKFTLERYLHPLSPIKLFSD